MASYHRGQTVRFNQLFLNQSGQEGTITGTPTISVYYWNGSTVTTLVNAASMTQLTGNLYGYSYTISNTASYGEYTAVFSATVDGISGKGASTYQVERYIRDGLIKRTAAYTGSTLNTYTEVYSRDSFVTALETTTITFTYDGNGNVSITTGSE